MRRQCLDAGPMGRMLDGSCFLQPLPPWAGKSKQLPVCPAPRLFPPANHAGSVRSWTRPWTFPSAPVAAHLIGFGHGCARGGPENMQLSLGHHFPRGGASSAARRRSMQVLVAHAVPIAQPLGYGARLDATDKEGTRAVPREAPASHGLPAGGLDSAGIDGPEVLGAAYASTPTAFLCFCGPMASRGPCRGLGPYPTSSVGGTAGQEVVRS